MRFEVEVGGRRRVVHVQQTPGGWRVELDGRVLIASLEAAGPRWSMLVQPEGGGAWTSREITAAVSHAGERLVHVDGLPVTVRFGPAGGPGGRHGMTAASAAGPVPVRSPMPGRVAAVLVKPGEDVAVRHGLVVVEAMKMENEIRAPRAGRVTSVHVAAGDAVEAQTVLVVIE